jgi:peroxiredoxin
MPSSFFSTILLARSLYLPARYRLLRPIAKRYAEGCPFAGRPVHKNFVAASHPASTSTSPDAYCLNPPLNDGASAVYPAGRLCYTPPVMEAIARHFPILPVAVALLIGTWPACAGESEQQGGESVRIDPGEFRIGRWAAAVTVPGGDIHFDIRLGRAGGDDGGYTAVLINGEERVPVGEVSASGRSIRLLFPAFNSWIEAELDGGVLTGSLTLTKRGGVTQVMPFRAEFAEGYTIAVEGPPPQIDVTGRWDVTFVTEEGDSSQAVGEFRQDGGQISGTFLTPTGDYRFLSGTAAGREFALWCFDGAHAYRFAGRVGQDDTIDGDFWSGAKSHERWAARRDESAALPDPYQLTRLREGYDRIQFRFPDLDGNMVSLDDPRFTGKVVIVALAGSWCPNSHDEAAFLSRYYNENRNRGLEIVGLMYEHLRDEQAAVTQIRRFQKNHKIEYTLLYAGYSDKEEAQKTLPMLDRIVSFPTMLFIDRSGVVRRIHTGFSGPGTGPHYEAFKREFSEIMDGLLSG